MVKSMDKRSALERLQCAFDQKRGTPLTKKDVAEVWGLIVGLRELAKAAMAQSAFVVPAGALDHVPDLPPGKIEILPEPVILNLGQIAANERLEDEVW